MSWDFRFVVAGSVLDRIGCFGIVVLINRRLDTKFFFSYGVMSSQSACLGSNGANFGWFFF